MTAAEARRHLTRLAAGPRPAGSSSEAAARRYSADHLAALGFQTSEVPFEYSAFPGRLATPLAGILSIMTLALAGHLGSRGNGLAALSLLAAVLVLGVPAAMLAARSGVLTVTFQREWGTNLRATRGGGEPQVWLVAHLDSKSQPIPIALRAVGIMLLAAAWMVAVGVSAAQVAGAPVQGWWIWITGAGVLAGLPVTASVVGSRSPGALDNASGVAAVLIAAAIVDRSIPLGVLLTSAEELGLAGARAWAATAPPAAAINCDTVDDGAPMLCLVPGGTRGGVADALVASGGMVGIPVTRRRILPGILVDAVPLADAGWDCATVAAATWRTLWRVHSARDSVDHIRGDGIVAAATLIATTVESLVARR